MQRYLPIILLILIQSCGPGPKPGPGGAVSWDKLRGWTHDTQASSWNALLASCGKIGEQPRWRAVCREASKIHHPTDEQARAFFQTHFTPHPMIGEDGGSDGLITGYYEPLLHGSLKPDGRYRYPIYAPPDDLLTIDLGTVYPSLAGRGLRGRLEGRTVRPYPDRARIEAHPEELAGSELLWVDDPVDLFFLQVQGSGRVLLPGGRTVAVRYADNNGRPYRSIGKRLIEAGAIRRDQVNLFTIRKWLHQHPTEARKLLRYNPRYIFFRLERNAPDNPEGAMGVALSAGRSLAVDKQKIPLGAPIWLETSMPGHPDRPLNRLMVAQDTGGAIHGYNRADVFWGQGDEAEKRAGLMKQQGRMFLLLPAGE